MYVCMCVFVHKADNNARKFWKFLDISLLRFPGLITGLERDVLSSPMSLKTGCPDIRGLMIQP